MQAIIRVQCRIHTTGSPAIAAALPVFPICLTAIRRANHKAPGTWSRSPIQYKWVPNQRSRWGTCHFFAEDQICMAYIDISQVIVTDSLHDTYTWINLPTYLPTATHIPTMNIAWIPWTLGAQSTCWKSPNLLYVSTGAYFLQILASSIVSPPSLLRHASTIQLLIGSLFANAGRRNLMLFGTVGGGISEYISKSVSPSCIQLRILYLYFLLPETKNITLCVFSFLCGFRTHFYIHFHSEEMNRLFAPDLKPWKA